MYKNLKIVNLFCKYNINYNTCLQIYFLVISNTYAYLKNQILRII